MIILTKKKQAEILNILAANQIIINNFDNLDGINKFQAFGQFCDNTTQAILAIGGVPAVNEAKKVIFERDNTNND